MGEGEITKADLAFNIAMASAKGVSALAIILEKNIGITGAAGAVHRVMLDGLEEAAGEPRFPEADLLAKMFGPNWPPKESAGQSPRPDTDDPQ